MTGPPKPWQGLKEFAYKRPFKWFDTFDLAGKCVKVTAYDVPGDRVYEAVGNRRLQRASALVNKLAVEAKKMRRGDQLYIAQDNQQYLIEENGADPTDEDSYSGLPDHLKDQY